MSQVVGEAVLDAVVNLHKQFSDLRELEWQLKKLRAVRDWALDQQPVKAGGRARIARPMNIEEGSGWYSHRRSLQVGAVGDIVDVDYNAHYDYWGATFVPDRIWYWGFRNEWVETDRRSGFFVAMKYLASVTPEDDERWVVEP